MAVTFEQKLSDSPLVEGIWRTEAYSDGQDMVAADTSWDMIILRLNGQTTLSIWGPMSKASPITHLEGSEYIGIRFKLGTFMSSLAAYSLVNVGTTLPQASGKSFWLEGLGWEYPTYENADTFINRLARGGLIGSDPVVQAVAQGHSTAMSMRTVQRRFQRITGLTQRYIRSIERAQQAAALLASGRSILDTVYDAGYADQQHMTTSLRRFLGQTPAQIGGIRNVE